MGKTPQIASIAQLSAGKRRTEFRYAGYLAMEYLPLGDPVQSLTKALNDFRTAMV